MITFFIWYYIFVLLFVWVIVELSKNTEAMTVLCSKIIQASNKAGVKSSLMVTCYSLYVVTLLPFTLPYFMIKSALK